MFFRTKYKLPIEIHTENGLHGTEMVSINLLTENIINRNVSFLRDRSCQTGMTLPLLFWPVFFTNYSVVIVHSSSLSIDCQRINFVILLEKDPNEYMPVINVWSLSSFRHLRSKFQIIVCFFIAISHLEETTTIGKNIHLEHRIAVPKLPLFQHSKQEKHRRRIARHSFATSRTCNHPDAALKPSILRHRTVI